MILVSRYKTTCPSCGAMPGTRCHVSGGGQSTDPTQELAHEGRRLEPDGLVLSGVDDDEAKVRYLQVDRHGHVVLSDADVKRIAEAVSGSFMRDPYDRILLSDTDIAKIAAAVVMQLMSRGFAERGYTTGAGTCCVIPGCDQDAVLGKLRCARHS